jgi:S-methylmethionine-dependent homocysteine/selenocysteine methylase
MNEAPALTVLDGALGTELTRRGVDTALPLWSAIALDSAPEVVAQIHADYAAAGAQVLTTNTFRTNRRALAKASIAQRAAELTRHAVELARMGASGSGCRIAGSMAPVEDCYTPELVPDAAMLADEHGELARNLAAAGVDLYLVETMNTIREACAAAGAARAAEPDKPLWVSFTLGPDNALLSGETLREALAALRGFAPDAVLVNCIPVAQGDAALRALAAARDQVGLTAALGIYGNVGHVDDAVGWTLTDAVTPAAYADAARAWRALGASIIGGCCGTTPAHTARVARSARAYATDSSRLAIGSPHLRLRSGHGIESISRRV